MDKSCQRDKIIGYRAVAPLHEEQAGEPIKLRQAGEPIRLDVWKNRKQTCHRERRTLQDYMEYVFGW